MTQAETFEIVPVGPTDAVALANTHVKSWRETYAGVLPQAHLDQLSVVRHARGWRGRLMAMREITLAAEGPHGLVGYVSAETSREGVEGEAEITTLYVLRSAQGQGLGRRLMLAAARVLAARGSASLVIWVLRDNRNARGFYERMGGRLEGMRNERVGGRAVAAVCYRWADIKRLAA